MQEFETGESKKQQPNTTWLGKQTAFCQFFLVIFPALLLTIAVVVLAVLYVEAVNAETPVNVCSTDNCVSTAGSILASMNRKIDPCQDFYQYTCGGYERTQNMPSGYSKYGSFNQADNLIQKDLKAILEGPAPAKEGAARKKSRTYYHACMNATKIAENGGPALQTLATNMGGFVLKSPASSVPADWTLNSLLEKRNHYSTSGFFAFYVSEDIKNVKANLLEVSQGGLGLGSGTRNYYIAKDVLTDPVLKAYTEMLTTYAQLIAGESEVDPTLVVDVVRFEQELAAVHLPNADMRDPNALYNKRTMQWFNEKAPFIDWLQFFQSIYTQIKSPITLTKDEVVLLYSTDAFLENMNTLMQKYLSTAEGKRALHNYAIFRAVSSYAPSFGGNFRAAYDKFQVVYSGRQGSLPDWQVCVSDTDDTVGFGLGAIYIDENFIEAGKTTAEFIIERVTAAFRNRVTKLDWMDDTTKKQALAKVDALRYEAAYPTWLKNDTFLDNKYAALVIEDDYVANQFHAYDYSFAESFSALRSGPDPNYWYMTPQTVNAYYSPTENKFVVPAGILSPPFFYQSPEVPLAVNFAAIGTVIGHEIGHGFDDSGSQFDKDGNLNNWWTDATLQKFEEKTKCLIDQYDSYEVDGLHLDGEQTLGENIGDNGGLRASYDAYKASVKSTNIETLAGLTELTPEQLFFVSYGQIWCSLYTPESMKNQIEQNVHSPGPFRVNGPVSNSEDFANAFKCAKNTPMNPTKKCDVW